jgi:hypothetical protein
MCATQANGECHLRFGARTVSQTRVILVGGLIAAALDITYACIVYGPLSFHLSPTEVLQSVASGWVGDDAANAGGAVMALLGLTTHFMIATAKIVK